MKRLRLHAHVIVAVALGTAGCREAMTGTLDVSETIAFSSAAGPRRLPPGQYAVRVTAADSRSLTMRITPPTGDVVTAALRSRVAPDSEGEGRISSFESGQPFDVAYQLSSSRLETPLPATSETCTFETTETRCRTVTEYDFQSGQTSEHWQCFSEPVRRQGTVQTHSVTARLIRRVEGQVLDPKSGRQLAWLRAETDRQRPYQASTRCGLQDR